MYGYEECKQRLNFNNEVQGQVTGLYNCVMDQEDEVQINGPN